MATAAQNYQMLNDALAQNFVAPINNYVAQNTALGIQRTQQAHAEALQAANIAAERDFQIKRQERAFEENARSQQSAYENQLALQSLRARDEHAGRLDLAKITSDDRQEQIKLKRAMELLQDPLMEGVDINQSADEIINEYQKRRKPEYQDAWAEGKAKGAAERLNSAQNLLVSAMGQADERARKTGTIKAMQDPSILKRLADGGIDINSKDEVLKRAQDGDWKALGELVDRAANNKLWGKSAAKAEILGMLTQYTAAEGGFDPKNPVYILPLQQLQSASKEFSDYVGRVQDPKRIEGLNNLLLPKKPVIPVPDKAAVQPQGTEAFLRGLATASPIPQAAPPVIPQNSDIAGLIRQQAAQSQFNPLTGAAFVAPRPVANPVSALQAPLNFYMPPTVIPGGVMPSNAPGNPFVGF